VGQRAEIVPDADQVRLFLSTLFDDAVSDHGLCMSLFCLPSREPRFFTGDQAIESAVAWSVERATTQNVYACMGLFAEPVQGGGRGGAQDVVGIPGFWADIDVAHDTAHKGKKYPATMQDAHSIACEVGVRPTFHVDSGFGLHAYWLFQEPLTFDDDDARKTVQTYSQRWTGTIQSCAKKRGWYVDSTWQIERVLRVAGTLNHKDQSSPRLVVMHRPPKLARYLVDDLEPLMIAAEYLQSGPGLLADVAHFTLHPEVEFDSDLLSAARSNISEFEETWSGARRDLSDQSPSAYDMALANMMVAIGWDDQQIVDALVYWRRKRGHKPKLRVDYYQRTIGKARAARASDQAVKQLTAENSDVPTTISPQNMTSKDREMVVQWLRNYLGIKICGYRKVGDDNATYFILLDDDIMFSLGNAQTVFRWSDVRARIYEKCGVVIPRADASTWDAVVCRLESIVESYTHEEARTQDVMFSLLRSYLDSVPVLQAEEWQRALRDEAPFIHQDGTINVNVNHFKRWVRTTSGENLSRDTVWRDFRLLGMSSMRREGRDRGKRRNRTYWSVDAKRIMDTVDDDSTIPAGVDVVDEEIPI
jgi:hypothetical protein